jgi:hypothetical protein
MHLERGDENFDEPGDFGGFPWRYFARRDCRHNRAQGRRRVARALNCESAWNPGAEGSQWLHASWKGDYPALDLLPGPVPTGRREYMLFMLLLYKRPRR